MRYQGGKSRISKTIAKTMNSLLGRGGRETFVSLFYGSCSIESKIKGFNRMILNDKHKYLIDLINLK